MADDSTTKYFYDFHYPFPLVRLLLSLLGGKNAAPSTAQDPSTREWFSQTRNSGDATTEVITTSFRLPLSVSEISTEVLRMPCQLEVWYQDRSGRWDRVLDAQRNPLGVTVSRADTKSWYKFAARCYPIVAKQIQLRLTRTPDPELADVPYPVGLKNTLIRRNVYDRRQGGSFEDYVDVMGNLVSRYIKDWDAGRATDDNYTTFWRSAPQPDPSAVVSLFLDVRSPGGEPQVVDKVYLDPVHTGQHLNLYYSNDDTVAARVLSPITVPSTGDLNVEWRPGVGLTDIGSGTQGSYRGWTLNTGSESAQPGWIGVEWIPAFDSAGANFPFNMQLFRADGGGAAYGPELTYNPELRTFTLGFAGLFEDSTDFREYTTPALAADWDAGQTVRVVAGWRYTPTPRVHVRVVVQGGATLLEYDGYPTTLPVRTSFGGESSVGNFRGTITNLIAKVEDWASGEAGFLADPTTYTEPDPVLPGEDGRMPSTSLDNAVYAAPWVSREHGAGGADSSHYEDKEWTPVWRDYTAVKGFLHLPAPVGAKYLKLEFSNLTEEPYPIYQSGIEVRYKVFPVSVTQQSWLGRKAYSGKGGFLGMGTFISVNGVKSVNWFNPASVAQAVTALYGVQTPPVIINTGTPYITTTMPRQGAQLVEDSRRIEAASSYVYARETLQPYVLAADQYNTIIKAEGLQAIQPFVNVPWKDIEAANPGAVTKVRSTGTVPIRGSDWWIYPGQQLKVPAAVMERLTATQTVTERKLTLERRVRFSTVSVHRYDYRTVERDAAIGYFAAVREVQPYTASYIAGEDKPVFDFPIYDPTQWVFDEHIVRCTRINGLGETEFAGPIKTALPGPGTASKILSTQSDFSRVTLEYQDGPGLLRSNTIWAAEDDDGTEGQRLSPYVSVLPSSIPTGTWSDATKDWNDTEAKWGSPFGIISANLSDERRFQGSRVLSFTRDADISSAGEGVEAGINLNQYLGFIPGSVMRFGLVYFKPYANKNTLRLRMTCSDNTVGTAGVVYSETIVPQVGQWVRHDTSFVVVPETLQNNGFSGSLTNWVGGGSSAWNFDGTVGRTVLSSGPGSAKVIGDGTTTTLTSDKSLFFAGEKASCTAWVKWSGLSGAGRVISIRAAFYTSAGQTANSPTFTRDLTDQATVTAADGASGGWTLVGGSLDLPTTGASHVAFQITVAGATGPVWVDDVTASVPGAARQTYDLSLTVVGSSKDDLYVADLYTDVAPIRYFVRLGDGFNHEVTDLRYTRSETVVTSPVPVNEMTLRTVIMTPGARAGGMKATPLYLR